MKQKKEHKLKRNINDVLEGIKEKGEKKRTHKRLTMTDNVKREGVTYLCIRYETEATYVEHMMNDYQRNSNGKSSHKHLGQKQIFLRCTHLEREKV